MSSSYVNVSANILGSWRMCKPVLLRGREVGDLLGSVKLPDLLV